jgi:hypothetical protein
MVYINKNNINFMKITKILTFFTFIILLNNCSMFGKKNEGQNQESQIKKLTKKKRVAINASERAEQEKEGALMAALRGDNKETTYSFASSNPMWRATLISLEEIPLSTVDYAGGVIVTDWYSNGTEESLKININFTSNKISPSSIRVSTFKKNCLKDNCSIKKLDNSFNNQIKDKILAKAININIENTKKD